MPAHAVTRRNPLLWLLAALLLLPLAPGGSSPVAASDDVAVEVTVTAGGDPLENAEVALATEEASESTNTDDGGVARLIVAAGTYTLTVTPPEGSLFVPFVIPDFEVAGPGSVETTVALFLPGTGPVDPDDPVAPPEAPGTVSGRISNGDTAGVGVQVSFVGSGVLAVTDSTGAYRAEVPAGVWPVLIRQTGASAEGWPQEFEITLRESLTVISEEELVLDIELPFVRQEVGLLLPDGSPAVGFEARVRSVRSSTEMSRIIVESAATMPASGVAPVWVWPGGLGTGSVRGMGKGIYPDVVVRNLDVFSFPSAEPVVLRFTEVPTVSGRLLDHDGTPLSGRVRLRNESGSGGRFNTDSAGRFTVLSPTTGSGPYWLASEEERTTPRWSFTTEPFALDESINIGDVVLPRTPIRLCAVDEVTGLPVNVRTTIDKREAVELTGVPVFDGVSATFRFERLLNNLALGSARCWDAVLPPGVPINLSLNPDIYSDYYRTYTSVTVEPGQGPINFPVGRFDQLPDTEAVDVDLRLVNGLGITLKGLPVWMRQVFFSRIDVTDTTGRVSTRLLRNSHLVTELRAGRSSFPRTRGFISATGGASPDGQFDLTVRLDQVPTDTTRYDLGTVVLPFFPVDVTVRGSVSQPLNGAILETPRVQACAATGSILAEVCASSFYSATAGLRRPGITNDFGRERLWLVPGTHALTVTPNAENAALGYQPQTLNITVSGVGGQSVFVVLQTPNQGTAGPDAAPQVGIDGPNVVAQGGSVVLEAEVLAGTPTLFEWDLNNDGIFETVGQSVTFDAGARAVSSTPTVQVRACDVLNRCAVDETTITVVAADQGPGEPTDEDNGTDLIDEEDGTDATDEEGVTTPGVTTPVVTQPVVTEPETDQEAALPVAPVAPDSPDAEEQAAAPPGVPETPGVPATPGPVPAPTPGASGQLPDTGQSVVWLAAFALALSLLGMALIGQGRRRPVAQ